jgi:hypothetical protein
MLTILKDLRDRHPALIYAQGVLSGRPGFTNMIFAGLIETFITAQDKEEQGVGKYGLQYHPAWEELSHVLFIKSPQAYRALRKYLPAPSK